MPTYRLDIAYDGSGFHGYATQPKVRTIQAVLEDALFRITGEVETAVAGRTDKGVHASGQVVSFRCGSELDERRALRSLNRQLAPEIAVLSVATVSDDFHARFSATGRRYLYRIVNRLAADPFLAAYAWHYRHALDEEVMNAAVQPLVGEHDFASFCKRSDQPTVRVVRRVQWSRGGDLVELEIEASAFCHQMVRSVVAASVEVGRGKLPADALGSILAARDRAAGRGAAPPQGLTLVGVEYAG